MTRKLTVVMLDTNDNTVEANFSAVNPVATDNQLYTFGTGVANLTENTFIRVQVTETREVSGE